MNRIILYVMAFGALLGGFLGAAIALLATRNWKARSGFPSIQREHL